ncbi:MAG TPA: hypothetical protein VFN46_01710 [Acetobacteraceae bacterium]|nr:hypothetical protein [Acetobacteraceae bacterium]
MDTYGASDRLGLMSFNDFHLRVAAVRRNPARTLIEGCVPAGNVLTHGLVQPESRVLER